MHLSAGPSRTHDMGDRLLASSPLEYAPGPSIHRSCVVQPGAAVCRTCGPAGTASNRNLQSSPELSGPARSCVVQPGTASDRPLQCSPELRGPAGTASDRPLRFSRTASNRTNSVQPNLLLEHSLK